MISFASLFMSVCLVMMAFYHVLMFCSKADKVDKILNPLSWWNWAWRFSHLLFMMEGFVDKDATGLNKEFPYHSWLKTAIYCVMVWLSGNYINEAIKIRERYHADVSFEMTVASLMFFVGMASFYNC